MNKLSKVIRAKTGGAGRNSLAFQSCAIGMVELAMTNGFTGWERVVALQSVSRKEAVAKLNEFLK